MLWRRSELVTYWIQKIDLLTIFSSFQIAWCQWIREVTQKLSFNDLLLSNLDAWVVVIVNGVRDVPIGITLAHSETDRQGRYDQPVSVATLFYTIRL